MKLKKIHYFLPIIAFLAFTYVYIFKNDVPQFPVPLDREVIDCLRISINNISTTNNKIHIDLQSEKFTEYPQIVAPYLLRVTTKVGDLESYFSYPVLWDLKTYENRTSSFTVIQKAPGNVSVSVKCQNILLKEANLNIKSVSTLAIGSTHYITNDNKISTIQSTCINRTTITVFNELDSNAPNYTASKTLDATFEPKRGKINEVISSNAIVLKSAYIVQSLPSDANEMLFDAVLPVFVKQQKIGMLPIYLMAGDEDLKKNMEIISGHQPVISDEYRCLNEMLLVPARGNKDILSLRVQTDEDQLNDIFNSTTDFKKLRRMFNCNKSDNKTIVVAGDAEKYMNMCKDCKVSSIRGINDTEEIAQIVSTANVFIADDHDSYIQSVWLTEDSTLIADISEEAASLLESKLKINVHKKFNKDYCI